MNLKIMADNMKYENESLKEELNDLSLKYNCLIKKSQDFEIKTKKLYETNIDLQTVL